MVAWHICWSYTIFTSFSQVAISRPRPGPRPGPGLGMFTCVNQISWRRIFSCLYRFEIIHHHSLAIFYSGLFWKEIWFHNHPIVISFHAITVRAGWFYLQRNNYLYSGCCLIFSPRYSLLLFVWGSREGAPFGVLCMGQRLCIRPGRSILKVFHILYFI